MASKNFNRIKQLYLGMIPLVPLGYVMVHGFRGDQMWSKIYVRRSTIEPSLQLKELVEQEIDKIENLRKAKYHVVMTDELEPKVYGGMFLTSGAELQFPLRMGLDDVETARRIGANLEVDMGLSKHRRKVEVNSDTGDELISRLMLSDLAKRFVVQRQLQIANSGQFFAIPIFAWFGISSMGYVVLNGLSMIIGGYLAAISAVIFTFGGFSQFSRSFEAYKIQKIDEQVVRSGDEYAIGAIDFLKSTMKLNRLVRRILGDEGEHTISKIGDNSIEPVLLSTRLRNVRKLRDEMKKSKENEED